DWAKANRWGRWAWRSRPRGSSRWVTSWVVARCAERESPAVRALEGIERCVWLGRLAPYHGQRTGLTLVTAPVAPAAPSATADEALHAAALVPTCATW